MAAVPEGRKMALVLVPKFTAAASFIGSALILGDIAHIMYNQRRRHSNPTHSAAATAAGLSITPRHRILAGMCCCDLLSSSAWFLTSWPIPSSEASDGIVTWTMFNVGNQQTCSAQGFFIQWGGIGTVLYNASLALYYLLTIRFAVRNPSIAKYWEPWMHLIATGFPLATAIAGVALGLFNPVGWVCAIQAYPPWCLQTHEAEKQGIMETDCLRGDNAKFYQTLFWYWPACSVMVFMAVCMLIIYCKIRAVENNALSSYNNNFASSFREPGHLQRRFSIGAILYVGAMMLTWSLHVGTYIVWYATGKRINWWLSFWAAVFLPLQGFFNALIYFRRGSTSSGSRTFGLRSCCCPTNYRIKKNEKRKKGTNKEKQPLALEDGSPRRGEGEEHKEEEEDTKNNGNDDENYSIHDDRFVSGGSSFVNGGSSFVNGGSSNFLTNGGMNDTENGS